MASYRFGLRVRFAEQMARDQQRCRCSQPARLSCQKPSAANVTKPRERRPWHASSDRGDIARRAVSLSFRRASFSSQVIPVRMNFPLLEITGVTGSACPIDEPQHRPSRGRRLRTLVPPWGFLGLTPSWGIIRRPCADTIRAWLIRAQASTYFFP